MNDKLKNAEQAEIISKYSERLKQIVSSAYSNFLSSQNVNEFKQATDAHANGILLEIKNTFLLNNEQKDDLFKQYYGLLVDGCDDVKDLNNKHNIRQIIFKNLKEKQMFNNKHIVIEVANDKFKQEMDEMRHKIELEIQKAQKQQSEKTHQLPYEGQSGGAKNITQHKHNIEQKNVNNINQRSNAIFPNRTINDTGKYNNTGYVGNNIFDPFAVQRRNNYDYNSHIDKYTLPQNVDYEQLAPKQTFNPDDFYRYKSASDIITNRTQASIEEDYNFVRNEIRNGKMKKPLHNNGGKENDNNIPNINKRDNKLLMDLLMQQQKMNKDCIKQAYNKTDKNINNSVGLNDDKIVDKNNLNSNTLGQQQI